MRVTQRWFPLPALIIAVLGATGAPSGIVFLLAGVFALLSCRDLWQTILVLLLIALTVATSRPGIIGFELPFLLRFVIVGALLILTILNHGVGRGSPRPLVNLRTLLLLFLAAAAVGSITSVSLTESVQGYLATAATLAVPVVAATSRWRDRTVLADDLTLVYRYLVLVAAIGLGLAVAVGFSGRAAGIHANPNTYAFMCVLAFGLDLGLRTMTPKRVRAFVTPALVLGVLASGSRGALLGALLATAYLLLRRASRTDGRRVALILLVGGATLVAFPVTGPLDVRTVYERTFGEEEIDLSGRQVAWDNMLRLSAERPVFGHGLRVSGMLLRDRFATGAFDARLGGHSGYLTVLAETGWVGTVLLFSGVAVALRGRPRRPEDEALWMASSGTVVAGLGHMTAESFILGVGSPFPIVFWSAVAVTALLSTTSPSSGADHVRPSPRADSSDRTLER